MGGGICEFGRGGRREREGAWPRRWLCSREGKSSRWGLAVSKAWVHPENWRSKHEACRGGGCGFREKARSKKVVVGVWKSQSSEVKDSCIRRGKGRCLILRCSLERPGEAGEYLGWLSRQGFQ